MVRQKCWKIVKITKNNYSTILNNELQYCYITERWRIYLKALRSIIIWGVISALGAAGFAVMALNNGENINAIWLLTAAVCVYAVAYRFYSKFISNKVFQLDDKRK